MIAAALEKPAPTQHELQAGHWVGGAVLLQPRQFPSRNTPLLRRLVELIHDIENGRREMSAETFHELTEVLT